MLDCLCSWGHVEHVLELVCDWLPGEQPQRKVSLLGVALRLLDEERCTLETRRSPGNSVSLGCSPFFQSNSASKRKAQIHATLPVKPELALAYVEYLLTHPKNRECLLSAPREKLNHLLKALETSKV